MQKIQDVETTFGGTGVPVPRPNPFYCFFLNKEGEHEKVGRVVLLNKAGE